MLCAFIHHEHNQDNQNCIQLKGHNIDLKAQSNCLLSFLDELIIIFLRPAIFNVYLALPSLGLLSQFGPQLRLAHITATLYYKTSKSCGSDVILTSTTKAFVSRIPPCVPKVVTITEGGEIRIIGPVVYRHMVCSANNSQVKQINRPLPSSKPSLSK